MSVVEACRELGISRGRFYELRARYLTYGEAGLLPKPRRAAPGLAHGHDPRRA